MATTVTLNDHLAAKVAALAADVGLPMDAFVAQLLEALVDLGILIRDGIPVFKMPADRRS